MNKAVVTRRFYRWEEGHCSAGEYATRDRPMRTLQRLAARVWGAERQRAPVPVVVAGRGTPGPTRRLSYCAAEKFYDTKWLYRIELCRDHRCIWVLMHELAHALVPHAKYDHGPAFVRMFVYLMATYGHAPSLLAEAEGLT